MTVVPFSAETHYEEVSRWWEAHHWPVLPLDHLSEYGSLVMDGELPVCAGWIYRTDSAFGLFEWAVVNPDCSRDQRKAGLEMLLDFTRHLAAKLGIKSLFTTAQARNAVWISRLERNGFTVTDSKMTNLVAKVGG